MPPHLLRLAYIAEFLIAVIAVSLLWPLAGGQIHLDLMPWYAKLFLSLAVAFAIIMLTVSLVRHERVLHARSIVWVFLLLFLVIGMAAITYYYHLQEQDSDLDGADVAFATTHPAALSRV